MDKLIRDYWRSAQRIVRAEAHKWYYDQEADQEDVIQDTFVRILQYPPDVSKARDVQAYFLGYVYMNAKTVVLRRRGYHNGDKRPQSVTAKGEQATWPVGLYQVDPEGETNTLDERILPLVPSAETVYFASLPTKRQEDLRGAIAGLAPRQRTALTLRFYEELSVDAVASAMGLTYAQTSRAISEGLRTLRQRLNPDQNGYPKASAGSRKVLV